MLQARNIHKSYGSLSVLKGIDLQLQRAEIVTLVGSSGAGKSTLLQILGTLDQPDSGEVLFEDQVISEWPENRLSAFRNRHLGFVFQFHHLLPEFSALENVCLPAFIKGSGRDEALSRGKALLEQLQLGERMTHKPSQLSGGEQQRVAVARAMINQPDVILADEPTGNLDSANSEQLFALMLELSRRSGVAFLITTHNESLARRGDRMLRMRDGLLFPG